MSSISVNYAELQTKLSQKKAYKLSDVKDRIKKVAFDVVRFVDNDRLDHLWKIEGNGDEEYIVAMYDDEPKIAIASEELDWKTVPDRSGNINVFYQNNHIKKISLASIGVPEEDAWLVANSLGNRLASDNKFYDKFVESLTAEEKITLAEVKK